MPIPKPVKGSTKTARNAIACLVKVVAKPQVDRETGEAVVDELGNPVMARASRASETDYVNCTRASEDPGHLAVWQQMDQTRELYHNNGRRTTAGRGPTATTTSLLARGTM